jgi:predicted protein tyrosine phosphatase
VLFVCSQNKLRSPTAEQVFANRPGFEVTSAGTDPRADTPVSPEVLEWADLIFVMERTHRTKLSSRFRAHLKNKKIICLGIPDEYDFMDPDLIQLLKSKVRKFLPTT